MYQLRLLPVLSLLMSLATSNPVAAANASASEAQEALRQAVIFHRQAKDLALQFSAEVYNADLDKTEKYKGRLLLKDSTRFRLEVPGGTYVSNGKDYWEYHDKTKQAVVRSAQDMQGQALPGEVLLRFLDAEPLSATRTVVDGKEAMELRLDPAKAMKNLDSLAVVLDGKDHSLKRVTSRDVNGNETRYTLLSVKRNRGLKDKEFTFVPPRGVEVVDMR